MKRSTLPFALGVLLAGGPLHAATTYHLAPSGNGQTDLDNFQRVFDNLQAGDTVLLAGGDYYPNMRDTYNNLLILGKNGSVGNWIVIKPESGQHPILHLGNVGGSTGLSINNCSYLRVEGLELAGNPGTTCSGTGGGDWNGGVSHDMQFVNNIVHDFGRGGLSGNGSQDLIEGNTVYNCCFNGKEGYSGIDFFEPHLQASDNSHFASDNGALGNPNNTYSLIIRNNTVYNCHMDVPEYGFDRPVDGNGIILDKFTYAPDGANYTGRALVANNVVYNNGGNGIFAFHTSHVDLFNNTCWHNCRNVRGTDLGVAEDDSTDDYGYNNIAISDGGGQSPVDGSPTDVTALSLNGKVWFDNNIYNTHNQSANSNDFVVSDLAFIRPGTDGSADFHPAPGGPAIGSGLNLWQVGVDRDGNSRSPQNDRGAYQGSTPPLGQRISLHAASGYYVTCDLNDGAALKANQATSVLGWEQYDLQDAGGGLVALKAAANGDYVSCDLNSGDLLRAAWATGIGDWEKFQWVNVNGGFALRSPVTGYYVTCDLDHSDYLKADHAPAVQAWEVFVDPPLGPAPPTGLKAAASGGKVALSWKSTGLPGVTYSVFRGTATGKEGASAIKTDLTSVSWTDAGVTVGKTYFYTVKAVKAGQTSAASGEASAKP